MKDNGEEHIEFVHHNVYAYVMNEGKLECAKSGKVGLNQFWIGIAPFAWYKKIGMSMVLSTILPAVCGWGDTCSVLVLHGNGAQYPPLILEAGCGGQYSLLPLLMSRSPKPKYPSPLECSSDRRRCNLLFTISVQ